MGGQNGEHAVPPLAEQQELKPELVLIQLRPMEVPIVQVKPVRLVPQQRVWLTVGGVSGARVLRIAEGALKPELVLIQLRRVEEQTVAEKLLKVATHIRVMHRWYVIKLVAITLSVLPTLPVLVVFAETRSVATGMTVLVQHQPQHPRRLSSQRQDQQP